MRQAIVRTNAHASHASVPRPIDNLSVRSDGLTWLLEPGLEVRIIFCTRRIQGTLKASISYSRPS